MPNIKPTTLYILKNRPKLFGRTLYKIGITNGPAERRAASIAGDGMANKVVHQTRMWDARRMEKKLHQRFRHQNRKGTGSGKTEWFELNWLQVGMLRMELMAWGCLQQVAVLAAIAWLVYRVFCSF
jgi:hypothetical protein